MFSNLLSLLYAFFFFNGEFIKFSSSLQRVPVSTAECVFMKKALHGNTPNLQSSAARAPAALRAEANCSSPPGKQGKPGNTLGIASGCETSARHGTACGVRNEWDCRLKCEEHIGPDSLQIWVSAFQSQEGKQRVSALPSFPHCS